MNATDNSLAPLFRMARRAVPRLPGRIATLVVDAEEDFDWAAPAEGTPYSTLCMRHINDLAEILDGNGVVPTYLLTYPVLEDRDVVRLLDREANRGRCQVGVQLHAWVTPPFEVESGRQSSFAGNLYLNLEERKLLHLKEKFTASFGRAPTAYRAGRYGLGYQSALLLEKHGFEIDTSVAPRTTMTADGGPDYGAYDYDIFWFGEHRDLLEVPLCRSIVGWGGAVGRALYRRWSAGRLRPLRIASLLAASRIAERITLSPEGNDLAETVRLVRGLLARRQTILPISFHSSSLTPGRNPYVRSRADLHAFYDRLSGLLAHLADDLGFAFRALTDIPAVLAPPDVRRP
jgi:hypothetical protein